MSDDHLGRQADQPDEPADPWLVDRILSGSAGAEWSSLHAVVSAVTAPPTPEELAGEQQAVAAFVAAGALGPVGAKAEGPRSAARRGSRARRASLVPHRLAGRAAVAAAAGVVLLGAGGLTAAAYTGVLPDGLQGVAHRAIGAPQPAAPSLWTAEGPSALPTFTTPQGSEPASGAPATSSASTTARSTTTAPTATSVEQIRLCSELRAHRLPTGASGYRSLTEAAGAVDLVKYCATSTTRRTFAPPVSTTTSPTTSPTSTTGTATSTATSSTTTAPTATETPAQQPDAQLTGP